VANPALYILDVFAEEKWAGNQLAVFRHMGAATDAEMQALAKEMNYSETTFIVSEEPCNGGYDVRIFSPEKELPFAGHPTLGTAYVIQREIIGQPVESVALNLKVGQIPVTLHYNEGAVDRLWMTQKPPTAGRTFEPDAIAPVVGLEEKELDDRFPIQEISTGVPACIVPLKTLDALKKAAIAKDRYFDLIANTDAKLILVFAPETRNPKNNLSVRVFADYYGVPEDPATGAANGCLAGYLVMHRYFGTEQIDIQVEQGHEIGRPSLLLLRAQKQDGGIEIRVGGQVIMVARGELV